MLPKYLAKTLCRHAVTVVSLFMLAGCLQSADTDTPEDVPVDDGTEEQASTHRLTGSVGDGPITDAQVRVNAKDGRSLVITNSDSSANYDIAVETLAADYPLSVLAVGGTDLVTFTAPDFDMRSAVKSSGTNSVANLNPFTTVAMELAADLQGGLTPSNIDSAMQIVVRELNSGLTTLAGSSAMQSEINGGNIAELMRASEALGELVRRTRDALSATGRNESGNDIVAAIGSDLTDGVLDGRGGPRADARIAAVAGVARAQIALETMQNQLRVQGTDATARIDSAMSLVFSGAVNPGLAGLRVTSGMLNAIRAGTTAANTIQPSNEFVTVLSEAGTVSAGMTSAQARQQISSDATTAFDNGILTVAGASADDIETINSVLRDNDTPDQNSAPVISGSPSANAFVGVLYSFVPTASDNDGDALTFSITGLPGWATFNTATGELRGVPGAGDIGSHPEIVISVSDGQASASLPVFALSVVNENTNSAPTISGVPGTQAMVGVPYVFQPAASDANGDALTFSISNAPAWATFNADNGALSGTPGESDTGEWANIVISVSDGQASASLPSFMILVTAAPGGNTPPVISGTPSSQVLVGSPYDFTPGASDADGDTLTFSVAGLPVWASFDTSSGRISGTPGETDVATYEGVSITVSDGEDSATLGPFSITVDAVTIGSATLSWTPPTQNTDGTPLTDLAGYRIYWGSSSGSYTNSVTLNNPGLTTYVIPNLTGGTWYFVSTALNNAGVESGYSNEASKVIQ